MSFFHIIQEVTFLVNANNDNKPKPLNWPRETLTLHTSNKLLKSNKIITKKPASINIESISSSFNSISAPAYYSTNVQNLQITNKS